jgi:predicted DNA-binding transcriptional regulator AlpA
MKNDAVPGDSNRLGTLTTSDDLNYPTDSATGYGECKRNRGQREGAKARLKPVPKPSVKFEDTTSIWLTVKELAARYELNVNTIYEHIKTDSTFPYRNVGVKKKFIIDLPGFEEWMRKRTERERFTALNIPTVAELLTRYK